MFMFIQIRVIYQLMQLPKQLKISVVHSNTDKLISFVGNFLQAIKMLTVH